VYLFFALSFYFEEIYHIILWSMCWFSL